MPLPAAAGPVPGLVEATIGRLEACGRLDAPEGVLVVSLARQLEAAGHTASGYAALASAFGKALAAATAGAPVADDVVDDLRRRRDERRRA